MYGSDEDADLPMQIRSWLAHSKGDMALVAARPPESYATGHAHRLFSDGRLHLVWIFWSFIPSIEAFSFLSPLHPTVLPLTSRTDIPDRNTSSNHPIVHRIYAT